MRIGVVFPQTEITADPVAVRDYAQTAEGLGYTHLLAYDHVVGADTARRPDWRGPYTMHSLFHEPFVLFGYLAAVTRRVGLVTGVIILPQRQTALVAKQAAEVDLLSGGRLRLGVGVGWNDVEYQELNEDFHTRGARLDEQIAVLRALWSDTAVTVNGRFHHIENAGINPLPLPPHRTIPIWVGGHSDAAIRRAARLGDGWFPQSPPNERMRESVALLRRSIADAGRPRDAVGIEARLTIAQVPESGRVAHVQGWRNLGADYLGVNTMGAGLATPADHFQALQRVMRTLADAHLAS
jgi:probable F420-dependent oxidoreductase